MELIFSVFKSLYESEPTTYGKTWSDIVHAFQKPPTVTPVKQGALFNLVQFDGVRSNDNARLVYGASLDIDDMRNLEAFRRAFNGVAFVQYTTHSHGLKQCAFRVVIPFAEPMPAEYYPAFYDHLNGLTGGHLDPACKDVAHMMYFPQVHPDRAHLYECHVSTSTALDWRKLPLTAAEPQPAQQHAQPVGNLSEHAGFIERAVMAIDPACDYDFMRNIALALLDMEGIDGANILRRWQAPRTARRRRNVEQMIKGHKRGNYKGRKTGIGTILKAAREHGFTESSGIKYESHIKPCYSWDACRYRIKEHGAKALPVVGDYIVQCGTPAEMLRRIEGLPTLFGTGELAKVEARLITAQDALNTARVEAQNARNDRDSAQATLKADKHAVTVERLQAKADDLREGLKAVSSEIQLIKAKSARVWQTFKNEITAPLRLEDCGYPVEAIDAEKLPAIDIAEGETVLIQSDLGTGKTHQTAAFIDTLGSKASVLANTPRISLTIDFAERTGLNDYQKVKAMPKDWQAKAARRMASTVNSLLGTTNSQYQYDLCVTDESELQGAHLIGETVEDKDATLAHLYEIYSSAKRVLCLDAFLSSVTVHQMKQAGRENIRIIRNTHKAWKGLPVRMYSTDGKAQAALMQALQRSNKCYVPTNSQRYAESLATLLAADMPHLNVLCITKTTRNQEQQQAFMHNPTSEACKYDVVICSPTVESGVSVDTDAFAHTFGFFWNSDDTGTPLAAIQQLARFRKAKEWHVFAEGKTRVLPTTPSEIMAQKSAKYAHDVIEVEACRSVIDFHENDVARLDCEVTAWNNKQKINFARTLYAMLEYMACDVSSDTAKSKQGRDAIKRGRELRGEQFAEDVMIAIPDPEAETGTPERTRADIERFLPVRFDAMQANAQRQMICVWKDGELAKHVKSLEHAFMTPDELQAEALRVIQYKHQTDKHQGVMLKARIRREMFDIAGVRMDANGLLYVDDLATWDNTSLKKTEWFKLLKKHETAAKACGLGATLRDGWQDAPARIFGEMLKSCGFSTSGKLTAVKPAENCNTPLQTARYNPSQGYVAKTKRMQKRVYRLSNTEPPALIFANMRTQVDALQNAA